MVARCMYLIVLNQCRQERGSKVQGCVFAPPWNFDIIYIFFMFKNLSNQTINNYTDTKLEFLQFLPL